MIGLADLYSIIEAKNLAIRIESNRIYVWGFPSWARHRAYLGSKSFQSIEELDKILNQIKTLSANKLDNFLF
jgi:hypothetical protein